MTDIGDKSIDPLERKKVQLEIDKLRLETLKLDREGKALYRVTNTIPPLIGAMVAIFTAMTAVGAIWISLNTLKEQAEEAHRKALQEALSMATDPKGGPERRISVLYQLRQFWGRDADDQIVGATITSLLVIPSTVEDAARVRCAATEVVSAIYEPSISQPQRDYIRKLLFGEAKSGSTGLITLQNYLLAHPPQDKPAPTENDPVLANRNCATPLAATREAIRKAWRDLRETICKRPISMVHNYMKQILALQICIKLQFTKLIFIVRTYREQH